jgi:hypothetical protein
MIDSINETMRLIDDMVELRKSVSTSPFGHEIHIFLSQEYTCMTKNPVHFPTCFLSHVQCSSCEKLVTDGKLLTTVTVDTWGSKCYIAFKSGISELQSG